VPLRAPAGLLDRAHNLMTRDEVRLWMRQFAIDDMQIGAANAACLHPNKHLSLARFRHRLACT
jgi:hypothetical protein